MLTNPTIETLKSLKLHGLLEALEEQQRTPAVHALSFEERIALLVDRERLWRENQRRTRLLRGARLKVAAASIEDIDYKDPDTGQLLNRELLNQELSKIEKPAGIANPKDFRNEVVKFTLRARAGHGGKNPSWTSYEKIREVIERRMFSQVEDLLPVISFGSKKDSESEKKHEEFVLRMTERGYTERQVRRLVEWYMRVKQAG